MLSDKLDRSLDSSSKPVELLNERMFGISRATDPDTMLKKRTFCLGKHFHYEQEACSFFVIFIHVCLLNCMFFVINYVITGN